MLPGPAAKTLRRRGALVLVLLVASCAGSVDLEGDPATGAFTYYQHTKPILDAKCAGCHTVGGVGGFALETWDDVFARRSLVAAAVADGRMPPWPPDPNCNDYRHDRSLSDLQRETLLDWIAADAPAGDPAAPADPLPTDALALPRVDATLTMDVPYEPTLAPDEYRCFLLDWPYAQRTYVTGFQIAPGNQAIVHHAEAHIALPEHVAAYEALDAAAEGPGYPCFGGVLGPQGGALGGWSPGHPGLLFPGDSGVRVEPGSKIVLQVHYHTSQGGGVDQTSFDVMVQDAVAREGFFMPWVDPRWVDGQMPIPAGDPEVVHRFTWEATTSLSTLLPFDVSSFRIWSAQLHLHYLATRASLSLTRSAGDDVCLLAIPRWDREWQADYFFVDAVRVDAGDSLTIECQWDNSEANQPVVDGAREPPRNVNWGWGSRDEMCVGFFYVTLD